MLVIPLGKMTTLTGITCQPNIGHCIHDTLQHVVRFTQQHNVTNWITTHDRREKTWQINVITLCASFLKVTLYYKGEQYPLNSDVIEIKHMMKNRHLQNLEWLAQLRTESWKHALHRPISYNFTGKVLYTRSDVNYRRILNWDKFAARFDSIYTSLDSCVANDGYVPGILAIHNAKHNTYFFKTLPNHGRTAI